MVLRSRWGHVLALAILGFAVVCSNANAQLIFSSPTNVSNNADASLNPQVAVNSTGTIYMVWSDNGASGSSILFTFSSDGGATFSAPKSISKPGGNSFNPRVMVDSLGSINAVWQDSASGSADIFFARSSDGGANFSVPVNLSNDSPASSGQQVAADSAGNIFVVWETDSGGSRGILFSRSLDGGVTFSAPLMLSTNTSGSVSPQMAVDLTGNISVVWEDDISPTSDISFSHSSDHGATFAPPQSLSHTTANFKNPQVAVDLAGSINVVWQNNTSGNFGIFFTRSTDGGQTFSAFRNLSNSSGASATPRIAIDLSGNINVLWAGNVPPATNTQIYFVRSSDGVSFSTPLNASTTTGLTTNPWLAVDRSGNINLVWEDTTTGNKDIFFTRSADAGVTFATQNLSKNAGASSVPRIVADKNGSLNVVWQDATFGPSQILFSRFTNAVVNHPPVADAGADQTVQPTGQNGVSVQLDGSKSSDPDGDTLTYSWTDQNGSIVGATAVVQLNLLPGSYTFTLTVTDPGKLNSSATTHVTVEPPPNHPPVADAGADQTIQATGQNGVSVQLNGSKSSDPDGDALTYAWTDQNANPVGSTAVVQLTLLPGTYTFTLTVTDPGKLSSSATTHVTVNAPVNHPPVANAGADQTVQATGQNGVSVQLDGSKSSDPDGDKLTYAWTDQNGNPVGSVAVVQLTLLPGNYTFTLTVTDPGKLNSSATTHVTVNPPPNHPPVANAGPDQTVQATGQNGVSVQLNGSKSSDPDGDTLSYAWTDQNGNPVSSAAVVQLTLMPGSYTFTLTVTDPGKLSSSAMTHVTVNAPVNHPPVANAGLDQTIPAHSPATVQLNGSASSDPDGDPLTYVWKDQLGTTVGNAPVVTLSLSPGTYTFTLTVTDPGGLSSSAMTHVTVTAPVNHPPVANAGASQTVGCAGQDGTAVTLNGSASSDPDGDTLTYVWKNSYGRIVGTTALVPLTLRAGTHTFTLTVTDPGGLSSSATTQVSIQDTAAPLLSVSLSPNSLQPPNHKLIPITASVSASDACSANVAVSLVSIVSSEPDNGTGDGDQPYDIQAIGGGPVPFGTDVRSFLLRAERSGGGNGRIYTVTYSATDRSGNSTSAVAYVVVGATLPDPPPDKTRGGRGNSGTHDDRDRDKDHDNDKDHKDKDHKDDRKDKDHDKDRKGDH